MPEVSVVIPTRNRSELLLRAVKSALAQTFAELEVIVVVDGPDEATLATLRTIEDRRLAIVAPTESVGGSEARNVGAERSSGQWIALLDDDDEWLPTKIEKQMAAAASCYPCQDLVTSMYYCRVVGAKDTVRPRRLPRPSEAMAEYMFDFLCYFQTSTFLCSRDLFSEFPFRKELKGLQDIDWFLRACLSPHTKVIIVPEPLSIYYVPGGRATITSTLDWKQRLNWGKANRNLLTRRAYSRFIAGSCVARAIQDRAGLRGFWELARECMLVGSPDASSLSLFFATYLTPPAARRKIRDLVFLSAKKIRSNTSRCWTASFCETSLSPRTFRCKRDPLLPARSRPLTEFGAYPS